MKPKLSLPLCRLDWQMWFAALGKAEQNPWFVSLMYRILQSKNLETFNTNETAKERTIAYCGQALKPSGRAHDF